MSNDANDFLMGAGVPAISWRTAQPGHRIEGTISREPQLMQQRDIATGDPLCWPDGKPKMQLVIDLQTGQRDDPDDDGVRRLYVKGKSMTDGFRQAVRGAGAKGLEVGGRVVVTYTGEGEAKARGFSPPKLYQVAYTPPAAGYLADGQDPNAGAVLEVKAPPGVDPGRWATMSAMQRESVLAAVGGTSPAADSSPPF